MHEIAHSPALRHMLTIPAPLSPAFATWRDTSTADGGLAINFNGQTTIIASGVGELLASEAASPSRPSSSW